MNHCCRSLRLAILVIVLLAAAFSPAGAATTPASRPARSESRQAYWRGDYKKAAQLYRRQLEESPDLAAAIGLADVLLTTGQTAQALDPLDVVVAAGQTRPQWHLARSRVLRELGRYPQALTHAEQATALRPAWAPALLLQGQLLETLGRRDEALGVYDRMQQTIASNAYLHDPPSLVALGKILDRYSVLTGRKASDQARNILHNYFQKATLQVDPTYWPAHVAAGQFLLSKHKPDQAAEEFKLALKYNRHLPSALAGLADVALEDWAFEKAIKQADKALAINPHHDGALLSKARCYMQWRKYEKVPPLLGPLLEVNPNHLAALSLLAAAHVRMDQPDRAQPLIDRVRQVNPQSALPAQTIGAWLEAGRQFAQAEQYFKQAIKLDPNLAEPHALLGKLYMQTGEEAQAVTALTRARQLDDFREDVARYLDIARRLKDYAVLESDHFIVKVDGRFDRILLEMVSDYMESIYDDVTGDFGHEPSRKTIIEILPYQQQFSARISGRAWIPTVGASTGRVIAMAAPHRQRGMLGNHNWTQVLRHEFTHTVTLDQTANRIPHWFTEACAVWQQRDKRAFQYVRALVAATRSGRLFPLEKLDWGFIRPKRSGDRLLAYSQAEWMLEYIIETHGFERVRRMLKAFGEGLDQAAVFKQTLNTTPDQFDKDFKQWARRKVLQWGFELDGPKHPRLTAKALKENPDDADALAEHALTLTAVSRKHRQAIDYARRALQQQADHPRALRALTLAELARGNHAAAIRAAEKLEQAEPNSRVAPRVLGECYLHQKQYARAITALELLQSRQPYDNYSYEQLARLYRQLGRPEKALPNLIYLHNHTLSDPQYARQIAEIYRQQSNRPAAIRFFREVTFINPYEPNALRTLAGLYLRERQFDPARQAAENLLLLEPDDSENWATVALIRYRIGKSNHSRPDLQAARQAAEKAHALQPSAQTRRILRYIDAALKKADNTGGEPS